MSYDITAHIQRGHHMRIRNANGILVYN